MSSEHTRDLFVLLAKYNTWMNEKVYAAAGELSPEELNADRGAFFGSILKTLTHVAIGDRIWLRRLADHPSQPAALAPMRDLPMPKALDELLFADFSELTAHRKMLDATIERWVGDLSDADLREPLRYTNLQGVRVCKPFAPLLLHFFNHQTHHRGQVTTLLSQLGRNVGATDLLLLIRDEVQPS